jgi:signal transduction histidine kinase/sensor domain CHASE-containing protein
MSLRKITVLMLVLTQIGLIAVLALTLNRTLIDYFDNDERQNMLQNLDQLSKQIDEEYVILESIGRDWGKWDDTYNFVTAKNSNYIETNLVESTFKDLKINIMVLANMQGEILYNQAYDLENETFIEPAKELTDYINQSKQIDFKSGEDNRHSVLILNGQPVLTILQPIVKTDGVGPVSGLLIIGRVFNEAYRERLSSLIDLPLDYRLFNNPELELDFANARPSVLASNRHVQVLDEEKISGYLSLKNTEGNPVVLLRISSARLFHRNGLKAIAYLQTALVISGLVFGVMMLLVTEMLVLNPLTHLKKEVEQIGSKKDLAARINLKGRGELAELGLLFNKTLADLELSQIERFNVEEKRQHDLQALYDISHDLLLGLDDNSSIKQACQITLERFDLSAVWVAWLQNKEDGYFRTMAFCGLSETLTKNLLDFLVPTFEKDLTEENYLLFKNSNETSDLPEALRSECPGAMLVLPFSANNGALVIHDNHSDDFSPDRLKILHAVANQIEIALNNIQLLMQINASRQTLQTLSNRLVEVQEHERKVLSMELHDEIGQFLTGLKILLEVEDRKLKENAQNTRLEEAVELCNELIKKVRELSQGLHPGVLDDLGLLPALVWMVERFNRQTGIQVNLQHYGLEDERLPESLEIVIYRLVQEGLTNVARYANTNHVNVRLWRQAEHLSLQIEDHGTGFNVEEVLTSSQGRGLMGMHERVALFAGQLIIESTPGKGTCLTVDLPIPTQGSKKNDD